MTIISITHQITKEMDKNCVFNYTKQKLFVRILHMFSNISPTLSFHITSFSSSIWIFYFYLFVTKRIYNLM